MGIVDLFHKNIAEIWTLFNTICSIMNYKTINIIKCWYIIYRNKKKIQKCDKQFTLKSLTNSLNCSMDETDSECLKMWLSVFWKRLHSFENHSNSEQLNSCAHFMCASSFSNMSTASSKLHTCTRLWTLFACYCSLLHHVVSR